MTTTDSVASREHQMFPVLDVDQIETAKRFASGPARKFAAGEQVYAIGEQGAPAWLVLAGSIKVIRRDGLTHEAPITSHGVGQITGEVNQLAGRPSIAGGRAGADGCTALPFDPAHLRALMVGSADVGEVVMRALILRRVGLIEQGSGGTVIVGVPGSPDIVRLQGFLTRSGYPNIVLDAASDKERACAGRADRRVACRSAAGGLSERESSQAAVGCRGCRVPGDHARSRSRRGVRRGDRRRGAGWAGGGGVCRV